MREILKEFPFILGPMAGITDSPFRRIMRKRGAGLMYSEMVSANGLDYNNKKSIKMLKFYPYEKPLGIQIFGAEEKVLCKAAEYIEKLGIDVIDLNLGCSVPKVIKKGAGAYLCRDLKKLRNILKSLVKAVSIPVTIKIRLGWDNENINALEVTKIAEEVGIYWVTIHGRTSKQFYTGKANWEYIAEIKTKTSIPIIGNGDIVSPYQAIEYLNKYKLDGIMIARGSLSNPFIFKQIRNLINNEPIYNPTIEDYINLIKEHIQYLKEYYNEHIAILHSRKFIRWYTTGFPKARRFRKLIFSINSIDKILEETYKFFTSLENIPQNKIFTINPILIDF